MTPDLRVYQPAGPTKALVLVLHGGRPWSARPTASWHSAYQRMVPFARALRDAVRPAGGEVWLLRNRVRGWNEPQQDAVADARWALAEAARRHPGVPVVVVGHSMGGRVALRVADHADVVGACALAPWVESSEPIDQLSGRAVLIAHGDLDEWTSCPQSYEFAVRARQVAASVARFEVPGCGHFMLRRPADWIGVVTCFVRGVLDETPHPAIAEAMRAPAPDGLRLPLPSGGWDRLPARAEARGLESQAGFLRHHHEPLAS
ncbi:alpha/beta fold hydrolase [Lentzea sp. E54]|uniref:alpha/beta fold hydrolase n=1 Tax=Lentzea xerophila TaxID=3435883 RepID=UPI003DA35252